MISFFSLVYELMFGNVNRATFLGSLMRRSTGVFNEKMDCARGSYFLGKSVGVGSINFMLVFWCRNVL